jgi:hypothetical protein
VELAGRSTQGGRLIKPGGGRRHPRYSADGDEARSYKLERVPSFAWSLRGQKSVRSVREKLARSEDPHRRGADQPAPRAPPRSAARPIRRIQTAIVRSSQAACSPGKLDQPVSYLAPAPGPPPRPLFRGGGRGYAVTVAWSPNWPAPSRPHHAGPIVGLTMPAPEPVASLAASTGQGGALRQPSQALPCTAFLGPALAWSSVYLASLTI